MADMCVFVMLVCGLALGVYVGVCVLVCVCQGTPVGAVC